MAQKPIDYAFAGFFISPRIRNVVEKPRMCRPNEGQFEIGSGFGRFTGICNRL